MTNKNDKYMNELIDLIMYTRKIENIQGLKNEIGLIDIEQINYELKLNKESQKCLTK